eukprot:4605313-Pleurochrysis_carterae.AAC.3
MSAHWAALIARLLRVHIVVGLTSSVARLSLDAIYDMVQVRAASDEQGDARLSLRIARSRKRKGANAAGGCLHRHRGRGSRRLGGEYLQLLEALEPERAEFA